MFGVSIQVSKKTLNEVQYALRDIPRGFPRAMRRGVNRTVDMAATRFKRLVAEQITAKKSRIAKGIGKHKASGNNFSGSIDASVKRLPLSSFTGVRRTSKGVTYRLSKSAGRKLIEHAFLARVTGGKSDPHESAAGSYGIAKALSGEKYAGKISHVGVFARKDKSRLPIQERFGPSIWRVADKSPGLLKKANKYAAEILERNIVSQTNEVIRKWNR